MYVNVNVNGFKNNKKKENYYNKTNEMNTKKKNLLDFLSLRYMWVITTIHNHTYVLYTFLFMLKAIY